MEPRKPAWAVAVGRDRFGLWADLQVQGVVQRMRWIPPGRFFMGSPPSEQGRWDEREGPQHEVILTHGFWMGETPVTQALWQALTGRNPSRFQSPDRPVEHVSWEECDAVIRDGLNSHHAADEDGVFRLPTEAEWEYACRAGTTTATYAGEIEILGANNAPILDDIAWYGGNSGVNFDLTNGSDSSGWANKQHDHTRAGTRRVKQKHPNTWGLYDMLGNVWEWCQDGLRSYSSAQQQHPWGPTTGGEHRVSRGGSWIGDAGSVRAAYRVANAPGSRFFGLGFRLVRGQGQQARTSKDQPEDGERSGGPARGDQRGAPPRAGLHERGRRG